MTEGVADPGTVLVRKKRKARKPPAIFVCGPSRDYFYGDPRPPQELGYFEFVEWQEAQLRKRRRPTKR